MSQARRDIFPGMNVRLKQCENKKGNRKVRYDLFISLKNSVSGQMVSYMSAVRPARRAKHQTQGRQSR